MIPLVSKQLSKSKRYKEFLELQATCVKASLQREKQQNSYTKKLRVINNNTGEITGVGSYVKTLAKNNQAIMQKSSAIVDIATNFGLTGIFITITNPSEYHPFFSSKNGDRFIRNNPRFNFETIEEAIIAGYKNLNKIFRNFYKRVKEISKHIYYINSVEPHKSHISHLHCLIFIDEKYIKDVKRIFKSHLQISKKTHNLIYFCKKS
ncbi:MAG: replication endonuclease [Campylobacterota bacterium]|nr:replication endonuclease [Campylobacterota bacterium]